MLAETRPDRERIVPGRNVMSVNDLTDMIRHLWYQLLLPILSLVILVTIFAFPVAQPTLGRSATLLDHLKSIIDVYLSTSSQSPSNSSLSQAPGSPSDKSQSHEVAPAGVAAILATPIVAPVLSALGAIFKESVYVFLIVLLVLSSIMDRFCIGYR
jgi:hypothetical protein